MNGSTTLPPITGPADIEMRQAANAIIGHLNSKDMAAAKAGLISFASLYLSNYTLGLDVLRMFRPEFFKFGLHKEDIAINRMIARLEGTPTYLSQAGFFRALSAAKLPALLGDFTTSLREDQLADTVVIACFPKSGSTFLQHCLVSATGYSPAHGAFAYQQNEQELSVSVLEKAASANTVVQQHFRATPANIEIARAFKFKTVVLVRNIFDALTSYRDMEANNDIEGSTSVFFNIQEMAPEQQLDAIIAKFGHWYIEFFASWMRVKDSQNVPFLFLRYEDMIVDKPKTLQDVMAYCGLMISENQSRDVIQSLESDKQRIRFNKGIPGRGQKAFSDAQKDRIQALTAFYPDVDFSPIGL